MCATATVKKQGPFWFFRERKQKAQHRNKEKRNDLRFGEAITKK